MGYIYQKAAFVREENKSRMAQNTAGDSHRVISSNPYAEARTIILGTSCTPHIPSSRTDQTRTDQTVAISSTILLQEKGTKRPNEN